MIVVLGLVYMEVGDPNPNPNPKQAFNDQLSSPGHPRQSWTLDSTLMDSVFQVLYSIKWYSGHFPFGQNWLARPFYSVIMKTSLLFKLPKTIQPNPTIKCTILRHKRDGVSTKTLGKKHFYCQKDWSCYCPAGQFWLLESALRFRTPIFSGMPDFFWTHWFWSSTSKTFPRFPNPRHATWGELPVQTLIQRLPLTRL